MSSGGTNTTTTQAAPNPQFQAAYGNAVSQAQQVAAQPLQQYSGNTVAPLSPDQSASISEVEGAQGIQDPYLNVASQDIQNATTPLWSGVQQFSPEAVQQYQSPYTQNVLSTTEASEANTDAQQQEQLQGNAISSGAWGGDRAGVAQGILGGQQALANNQTNAGIENAGYTNALGEFNTQQSSELGANEANAWLNSQAGYGEASLGSAAQNSALTGANALAAAGNTEQTQAQAELNVPYEQFLAQQAYPFQTTGWEANIAEGLGAGAGGTSSTTSPAPSTASQIAGLGLGAAGIAGQAGAFNGLFSGSGAGAGAGAVDMGTWDYRSGGVVGARSSGMGVHRAGGGGLGDAPVSLTVPNMDVSIVPGSPGLGSGTAGHGASPFLQPSGATSTTSGGGSGAAGIISDIGTVAKVASIFAARGGIVPHRGHANDDSGWDNEPHRATGTHGGGIAGRASGGSTSPPSSYVPPIPTDPSAYADEMAAAFGQARGGGIMGRAAGGAAGAPSGASGGGSGPVSVTIEPGSYKGSAGVPQINTAPLNFSPGGTGIAPAGAGNLAQAATSTNPNVQAYLNNTLQGADFTLPKPFMPTPAPPPATPPSAAQELFDAFSGGTGGSGGSQARGGIVAPQHRDAGGSVDDGDWDAPVPSGGIAPANGSALSNGVLMNESGGSMRPGITGDSGQAFGPMQVHPAALADVNAHLGTKYTTKQLVDNPTIGKLVGDTYLSMQQQRFHNPALAMAAYNAGPGATQAAVDSGKGLAGLPASTQAYVARGLRTAGVSGGSDSAGTGNGPPAPPPATGGESADPGISTSGGIAGSGGNSGLHGADPWLSLAKAGFSMAAGRSSHPLENIGAGAAAGVSDLEQQIGQGRQAEARNATLQQGQQRLGLEDKWHGATIDADAQHWSQQADQAKAQLAREQARDTATQNNEGSRLGLERQRLEQGKYTWQPGQGPGADGTQTNGSWRYPTNTSEQPTFYPGVVTQRTTNADSRNTNQQAGLDLRRQAQAATEAWRQQQGGRADAKATQDQINHMSDEAIRTWMGSRDLVTGKFGMTPEQAQAQAQATRGRAADNVTPPPAAAQAPGQQPQLADPLGIR